MLRHFLTHGWLTMDSRSFGLSLERKMLVSSANRWNLRILEYEGRSFIYSRNRRGPSTLLRMLVDSRL